MAKKENSEKGCWWDSMKSLFVSEDSGLTHKIKEDLDELSNTVINEASNAIAHTKNTFSGQFQGVMSAVHKINDAVMYNEENSNDNMERAFSSKTAQKRFLLLENDPATYTKEIENHLKRRYQDYLYSLDHSEYNPLTHENVSKLLLKRSSLKEIYNILVPQQVKEEEFWKRYYFRKALLEDKIAEEERRMRTEEDTANRVEWDKVNFSKDAELTEQQQEDILRDYELELNTKQKK